MNTVSNHHYWLHVNFPVPAKSKNSQSDAVRSTFSHNLRGRRVWAKSPVIDWSRSSVACEPNCGGTVAFHDADDDITVIWDSGNVTIHSKDELLRIAFLIGRHRTLQDHIDCLANRCKCKPAPVAGLAGNS
ncbi:MAG: hypothetical protein JST44_06995 [Cyanobacteria bacterium SZAS LIN-5]|nr:hypothetical protein [Cyanobacteria bacterium SZAS LIN-5]